MRNKFIKAFTLVEMLVALAVSSIIIGATYSSYQMVAAQYQKNMDVADMHTSGRAIMRIIERDIRMAGFEYRDKDAKVTYGTISNPLEIKDSGNKCCDEVTVIYDYYDEEAKKAERIKIRYWAEAYSSNKGSRYRLYKQKDILGENKKILAKPKLGNKDVMADYIEDLQIANIENTRLLYVASANYEVTSIDTVQKKGIATMKTNNRINSGLTFGPKGLLYGANSNYQIVIIDTKKMKQIGVVTSMSNRPSGGITLGPDGLLYVCTSGNAIMIVDPVQNKAVGVISSGLNYRANSDLAFGSDGLLYAGTSSDKVMIIDPVQKKQVGIIDSGINHRTYGGIAFKDKKIGQESLVTINLVLRTKNQYGKDRQFKKKDYHGGNFKLDKTDKYKRDTFSSTVLVRNLAL